jgi:hypothetical protein
MNVITLVTGFAALVTGFMASVIFFIAHEIFFITSVDFLQFSVGGGFVRQLTASLRQGSRRRIEWRALYVEYCIVPHYLCFFVNKHDKDIMKK